VTGRGRERPGKWSSAMVADKKGRANMKVEKITIPGRQRQVCDVKFRCQCGQRMKVRMRIHGSLTTIEDTIRQHTCIGVTM